MSFAISLLVALVFQMEMSRVSSGLFQLFSYFESPVIFLERDLKAHIRDTSPSEIKRRIKSALMRISKIFCL